MDKKFSIGRVIVIAGAFIAFAIGSGFATGQELLQFFAAYGSKIFLCVIVFILGNVYVNYNFLEAGRKGQFEKGSMVYNYFCGKYIGIIFDWFTVLFTFASFFVMIAGAGATLNQQFGLPPVVGGIIIAAMAGLTVMLGLNRLVDIIGRIGPVIIIICLFTGILGIATGSVTLAQADKMIPEMGVMKAANTWYMAMVSYLGFGMMWFAPFFAQIGKEEKQPRNAQFGAVVGVVVLALAILLCGLAIIKNIDIAGTSQVPMLVIVEKNSHILSVIFSLIIFAGIYTTACPLLWTPVNRLAKEGTATYKILALVLAAVGCVIGLAVPYANVVNFIYAVNGKIGFVLVAFIVLRNIRDLIMKNKAS